MDWVQQTKLQEVSIIAFADEQINQQMRDRFIRHTREVLRRKEVECEIWIVSPSGQETTPLTNSEKTRTARHVAHAIRSAEHETIAIMDCEYPLEVCHWESISTRVTDHNLQTWCYQKPATSGYKKLLISIYTFLMRQLLGVKKHTLRPGITLFRKSAINDEDLDVIEQDHPDGISQLICLSRLDRKLIIENESNEVCQEGLWGPAAFSQESRRLNPNSQKVRSLSDRTVRFWWNKVMFPRETYDFLCEQKPVSRPQKIVTWCILLAAAIFVFTSRLDYSLFEPDEARNAQLAMTILETGDWMSLSINSEPYWDKPPLLAWMTALSYKVFGVSEFATRVPAALCALMTIILMLSVGKRLVGFRAAAIGASLAIISSGFVFISRFATMDVLLSMFLTATILCSYVAWFESEFRRSWAVIAGIALGLGLLAKGPVAIVLTLIPFLVFTFMQHKSFKGGLKNIYWLAIPAILVAAPWYMAMCWVHPEFIEYYFWKNHVVRFTDTFVHREPFWYYLPMLLLVMFPASVLIPAAWRYFTSKRRTARSNRCKAHGLLTIYVVWILAFFSIADSKLPTYIMPALAPLALLFGAMLEQNVFAHARQRRAAVKTGLAPAKTRVRSIDKLPKRLSITLVCLIVVNSVVVLSLYPESRAPIWFMAISAILCVLLTRIGIRKASTPEKAWGAVAGLGLMLVMLSMTNLIPSIAEQRSINKAVQRIQTSQPFETAPVVFFGRDSHAVGMSINAKEVRRFDKDDVFPATNFLNKHPHSIVIASEEHLVKLREGIDWKVRIVKPENARHVYLFTAEVESIAQEIEWEHLQLR